MFDSKHTDHNIVDATPFGRDPMQELADACAKHDMLLGIYYSVWDLKHPAYDLNVGNPDYHQYQQFMLDHPATLEQRFGKTLRRNVPIPVGRRWHC